MRKIRKEFNCKSIIMFCIFLTLLCLITIGMTNNTANIAVADSFDIDAMLDYDFALDSVLVVLDETISAVNKIHSFDFFKGVELDSIIDLTKFDKMPNSIENFQQILKLTLKEPSKKNVRNAIIALRKIGGIESVEPNYLADINSEITNDVHFGALWGLSDNFGMHARSAWQITTGSKQVRVGIIDTGIARHDDLNANLTTGWDTYNNNSITTDDTHSHGTHVAGTIGAVGNNVVGVAGVNWNVTLVPLQAVNEDNRFPAGAVTSAINYAIAKWGTEEQIDILNYSVAAFGRSQAVRNAAAKYKGLFVWSAGNDDKNVDIDFESYGDFDLPNIISVGALKQNGERPNVNDWGYSIDSEGNRHNQGSNFSVSGKNVNIYAPGDKIFSTHLKNNYGYKSGTSMAAPHVTGVAALLLSLNPTLTGAELKELILQSADETNISIYDENGNTINQTVKKLNAYTAVRRMGYNTTILSDTEIRIDSLKDKNFDGDLNIPSVINGRYVSEIAPQAFSGQTLLKSVRFPVRIRSIGFDAFKDCTALTSAEWGYIDSDDEEDICLITYIGNAAFYNCNKLAQFNFPITLEYIGYNAFENCSSLQTVDLGNCNNLTNINNATFKNCTKLIGVTFADSIKIIGANAFDGCTILTLINSKDISNLQEIGNSAFENCNVGIFEAIDSLQTIGYNAFKNNQYMNKFIIPNTVTSIYSNAFEGCEKLTIFTPLQSQPSGWQNGWNCSNRPVVFGCEFDSNLESVLSFTKSATNPTNQNAVNGINNPDSAGRKFEGWYTTADYSGTMYEDIASAPYGKLYAKWKDSCVAEGSLITLADGTQKAVEELTGDEMLLVWNLHTGSFDIAPILFIDRDGRQEYEVINLTFSDGTTVKVISEHAFWDCDLNKYVFLRNDAHKYIGHYFNKQNGDGWTTVRLMSVDITTEVTSAYSPVTYGHLCYYVNGLLSMPGATEGLINIFDVDPETMKIDEVAFEQDIETYGLFTYEEFAEILPVPEQVFEAFNGKYLKVAIGKGLITVEELALLIERYSVFFE